MNPKSMFNMNAPRRRSSTDYLCVSCRTPNESLYRQYSSIKNIKLQTCLQCELDADPYIERELLLVLLDMILLRSSAYTHFLFNRKHFILELQEQQEQQRKTKETKYGYALLFNVFTMMIVSTFLKTMIRLKEEGISICLFDDHNDSDPYLMIHQGQLFRAFLWSTFHLGWLLSSSYLIVTFILSFETYNGGSKHDSSKMILLDQVCQSIFIPQLFHIVTLFVHMYEDSSGVRFLGSTFVACFHYYSLVSILEGTIAKGYENVKNNKVHKRGVRRLIGKLMIALPIIMSLDVKDFLLKL